MWSSPVTFGADAKTFNSRNHITIFSLWLRRERCSERIYRSEANVFVPLECSATSFSSSFGVHPLRMTTISSSTLNVGLTMAEEANAWEALSATKWALMNRIRNWAEHCSKLGCATAYESCSSILFSVKVWHFKGTVRSPGSSVGCERLQPAKRNVALFRDRLDVTLEAFPPPQTLLWPSRSWPYSTRWGSLLSGILITWPNRRSWRWRSMDSIDGIPALDLIPEWITLCHQRWPRINWRGLMWKDSSSLTGRRYWTHISQPCKMVEI